MKKAGLVLALVCAVLAGCGVDWFPPYERQPTTPDAFSFPQKTGIAFNTAVTSDPITVSGLSADSTGISIGGASGSTYSVNGGTATSSAGTVKNGDTVTVTHTSATAPASAISSTLSIGTGNQAQSANFVSVTRNVESFALTGGTPGSSTNPLAHSLLVANGSYLVSVTTQNGTGGISFDGINGTYFSNSTPQLFSLSNLMIVYLKGSAGSTITVTIDGVNSTFTVP